MISGFQGFMLSLIITIALSFLPAAFIVFIVREREVKAKHIQIVSGVKIEAYWLSNFVFDLIAFLTTSTILCVLLLLDGRDAYVGANFSIVVLNLFMFGVAIIPFSYLFSFLFHSHSSAQNAMIMFGLFGGLLLTILTFILYGLADRDVVNSIRFVFRLHPNYCISDVFLYLSIAILIDVGSFEKISRWDMAITGNDSVFLAWEAVVYFIMVIIIDKLILANRISLSDLSCVPIDPELKVQGKDVKDDQDVEREKKRIEDNEKKDLISLHGLRKVFPKKVAVNNLWFGVPSGQCFGFLGVNGAGKTTTLRMITGDELPTEGNVFIRGISAIKEPWKTRRLIGYCPQFDALLGLMTAEETLTMYARIRGYPEQDIKNMVEYLCNRLTLDQDDQHKRPCGTYSGGNKRKLSVAIALIGSPRCVFLDEPSTGMDPVSRRFMWNFISDTMKNRAVVLTTHSMEECEALCSRISILVYGRLRCIGSSQHLKSRFGTGFEVVISTDEENCDKIRDWLKNTFLDTVEIECYGGNMKFKLGKQSMALSEIFILIEDKKEEIGIIDYSVGQTTLEQIFIHFAQDGEKEHRAKLRGEAYTSKINLLEKEEEKEEKNKMEEEKNSVKEEKILNVHTT